MELIWFAIAFPASSDIQWVKHQNALMSIASMRGSDAGGGGPPLKNHKIQGFLAILIRIPALKTPKLPSQHSTLAPSWTRHRNAIQMAFFAGGAMMARL